MSIATLKPCSLKNHWCSTSTEATEPKQTCTLSSGHQIQATAYHPITTWS